MPQFKVEYTKEIKDAASPIDAANEVMVGIIREENLEFVVTNLDTGQKFSVDFNRERNEVIEIKTE